MRRLHPEFKKSIEIAARFGFISQDIFENFVTTKKQSMSYRLWDRIKKSRYFETYNNTAISNSYLKLSAHGKSNSDSYTKFLNVPAPAPQQLMHDEVLIKFSLHCERKGFFEFAWPEIFTKTYDVMFARHFVARHLKFPDLLFELGGPDKKFKVAIEFERTRKSNARYQTNLLSYSVQKHVDLVIYVTSHEAIEKAIKDAALKVSYPFDRKPVAFARTADFISNPSGFQLRMGSRALSFESLVQSLKQKQAAAA